MILGLRIYQICVACFIVVDIIKDRVKKSKTDRYYHVSLSKWVFMFGMFVGLILTFGAIAELEYVFEHPYENHTESVLIIILFLSCITFGTLIALVQKIWRIKYNDREIIFRNSFGISKTYKNATVSISHNKKMTVLFVNGKKITQWDENLVNIDQDMLIQDFYSKSTNKMKN